MMIPDVAEIMPSFHDSSSEPLTKLCIVWGKLAKHLTNVSDVGLVIEAISVAGKSFSEMVGWCCPSDEDRCSEKSSNDSTNLFLEPVSFADLFASLFSRLVSYRDHTFSFTRMDLKQLSSNFAQVG